MIIDEKKACSTHIPLSSRPRDLIYVIFFLIHIPATILLDLQAVYPTWLVASDSSLRKLADMYIDFTGDPTVGSVGGYFGPEAETSFLWLKCFMYSELFIQLPTFFYGAYNLYHNTNLATLYPLLIAYGAGTAMTTLPCIAALLAAPSTTAGGASLARETAKLVVRSMSTGSKESILPAITEIQRMILLSSYIPFFLIPLAISVDMAYRTHSLIAAGLKSKYQKVE